MDSRSRVGYFVEGGEASLHEGGDDVMAKIFEKNMG